MPKRTAALTDMWICAIKTAAKDIKLPVEGKHL
jgi:hypothetical protein